MRSDKLMINADSETIAALNRALTLKAAAALTLVVSFAVIAVTAPAHASVSRESAEFSAAFGSDPLTDKHDFINPQKSVAAVSGSLELERLFWMCDYTATAGSMQDNEIEMCGVVTEHMRLAKFDGDSEKLLAWWRLNKETEHQALAGATVIGRCAKGDA